MGTSAFDPKDTPHHSTAQPTRTVIRSLYAAIFIALVGLVVAASFVLDYVNKPTNALTLETASAHTTTPPITDAAISSARAIVAQGVPGGSGLPGDRENVKRYYAAVEILARAFDPCYVRCDTAPSGCCLERARWWLCSTAEGALPLQVCKSLPAAEPSCESSPSNPEYRSHK
jgi:hypothetical protein